MASVEKVVDQLKAAAEKLSRVANIAGATGLDLAVTAIRNIRHVLDRDGRLEKVMVSAVGWRAFVEVLGIDRDLAMRIERSIWQGGPIEELEGVSEEMANQIRVAFFFDEPPKSTAE